MIQPLFFRSFRVVSDLFLRRFEKQIEQNENNRKKIEQIRTDNTKTKGRIMIQPFLFRLIRFVSEIILALSKNNPRGVGGEGEPPAAAAARRGEERRGKERKGFGELLQHRPRQRIPGRIGGARHLKGIF